MILTPWKLERTLKRVRMELARLGLWKNLDDLDVVLVPIGITAYGWYRNRTIFIPVLTALYPYLQNTRGHLIDLLRHEFGHAFAESNYGCLRKNLFSSIFGARYDSGIEWEYDPRHHVSEYASMSPAEDFAEMFALYVRHGGRKPKYLCTRPVKDKWRFIHTLRM